MPPRSPVVLVLGLVVGLVAGYGLSELLHDPADAGLGLHGAEALGTPLEPERGGLAGRPGATSEDETPVDPDAPRAALSDRGRALLSEFETDGFPNEDDMHRGWTTLAMLYALSGRDEDMHRILDFAVEAGSDPTSILEVLSSLPTSRRLEALDALVARQPGVEWDDAALANMYQEFGATDRALAIAVLRLQRYSEEGPDWGMLDILYTNDPEGAAPFLLGLARANAWSAETVEYIADGVIDHVGAEAALPLVILGLELNPESFGLIESLSQVNAEEAIRWAESLLRKDPKNTEVWGKLGELRMRAGDTEGAFEAYAAAVRVNPKSEWLFELMKMDAARALPLISKTTAGVVDDEAIGMLAKTLMMTGDKAGALDVYLRAHDRDPGDVEWLEGIVRLDAEKAIEVLAPRAVPSPTSADDDIVGAYAKALFAAGQLDKAWEYFMYAHEHDGEDAEWKIHLARIDPRRALPLLEEGFGPDTTNVSILGPLAVAYAGIGETTKALRLLEQALEAGGASTLWYRELGRIAPVLAETRIKELLEATPEESTLWASLGYIYLDLSRRSEAREAFEKALSITDSYTWRLEATLLGA